MTYGEFLDVTEKVCIKKRYRGIEYPQWTAEIPIVLRSAI